MAFGDERDICFTCQHSIEHCEKEDGRLCRYMEATESAPNKRHKLMAKQDFAGVTEKPLFKLGEGMAKFADDVATYSEDWMRWDRWEIT